MTDELTVQLHAAMPFTGVLGATALKVGPDEVVLRLDWDATRCTSGGLLHGGALMGLADAAGGWCAFLNLPDGATGTATVTSATNFLRPVTSGVVEAVARPVDLRDRSEAGHRLLAVVELHGGVRRKDRPKLLECFGVMRRTIEDPDVVVDRRLGRLGHRTSSVVSLV